MQLTDNTADNPTNNLKWKFHLIGFFLCQFYKSIHGIFLGCHTLVVTFPATLPAITAKISRIGKLLPSLNTMAPLRTTPA